MSIFLRQQVEATLRTPDTKASILASKSATEYPNNIVNLFNLHGPKWITDKSLIQRAAIVFEKQSDEYKMLFNRIFEDENRFKRFCTLPSSLIGHHSCINGNLIHTVEVCEFMEMLLKINPPANNELAMALALYHDIGKCDEYEMTSKNHWKMTTRGRLIGHRITGIELISGAVLKYNIQFKKDHYESLMHGLSSSLNCAEWTGIRQVAMLEAMLLSTADRLSANGSLYQLTAAEYGFGEKHPHLKAAFFTIGGD